MRTWIVLAAGVGLAAASAGHAQERQLGAHEHGRGTLGISLEGSRLSLELEAPGADIVGFEHEAKTDKQKAAVAAAKKQLAAASTLFQIPPAAGCTLKETKVSVETEDDHHDHGHDAKGDGDKHHDAKGKDAHDHEHSAFRAEYAFDCKAPAGITSIGFGYFKVFAGAQKLNVTLVTPKLQSQFEVSRAKPSIDLAGMM